MDIINETAERGVVERRFDLKVGTDIVPGIIWTPERKTGPRPTVMIGHGGTQHKRVANVLGLARSFVRHQGFAAVALDAPGHGDRVTDEDAANTARRRLQSRIAQGRAAGEAAPLQLDAEEAQVWVGRTTKGVAEWKTLLDDLRSDPALGNGPFGYWGVSMGTAIGLPFVSSEPRVKAAVLGLSGLSNRPGGDRFEQAARSLSIPVLFLFQWSDELVSREAGMALFDAFGSKEKTLHANPGGHVETPRFERLAAEEFFVRHLGAAN